MQIDADRGLKKKKKKKEEFYIKGYGVDWTNIMGANVLHIL